MRPPGVPFWVSFRHGFFIAGSRQTARSSVIPGDATYVRYGTLLFSFPFFIHIFFFEPSHAWPNGQTPLPGRYGLLIPLLSVSESCPDRNIRLYLLIAYLSGRGLAPGGESDSLSSLFSSSALTLSPHPNPPHLNHASMPPQSSPLPLTISTPASITPSRTMQP